jgi:predicted phosphate transport protein (TIGR00153 family)
MARFSLVPKERQFFVLFREDMDNLRKAIELLREMLAASDGFPDFARRLKDIEHLGDDITHRIIRELNTTFITPFDREDIYALASSLDDVLDLVEETAETIVLDDIQAITPEAREMADILAQIGDEMVAAIDHLDARDSLAQHTVRIHDLENQGDRVTRQAMGALFRNVTDAIEIIKWKDVYALLEKTVDATEDIANILENVTIKNA